MKIEDLYIDYDWRNVLSFAGPTPTYDNLYSTTYGDIKISRCFGEKDCSIDPVEKDNIEEIIAYDDGKMMEKIGY